MIETRKQDRLIRLKDVSKMLGIPYAAALGLVVKGKLTAFDVSGENINLNEIEIGTRGLKVWESDLDRFIDSNRVK